MSLATYVTYVLPIVVLAIGGGALALNVTLRRRARTGKAGAHGAEPRPRTRVPAG